jgi:phosphonate transport system substrate-binding protein
VSSLLLSTPSAAQSQLPFVVHPFDNPRRLFARFHPLARYLTQSSIPTKLELLTSYQEQLERITCNQHPCIAYLGPSTFYIANKLNPSIQAIAVESIGQRTDFHAVVVSNKMIEKPLANYRFAMGDELSLGSTLYPRYWLKKQGIDLQDLSGYISLRNHDQIIQALLHDQADIGCVREDIAQIYIDRGLHLLHRSPPLPPHIVVASPATTDDQVMMIREKLLSPDAQGLTAFSALGKARAFAPYQAKSYQPLEQLLQQLSQFKP